jgi:hypothetical protein
VAKRGILEHPKLMALAESLGIMDPWALGLLEAFWHWVAKYHPNGDLTGTRPSLFARSIRYTGDADELWGRLLDCGFIDKLDDGRVLVHDWSEHADSAVHKALKKRHELFADGNEPFTRNKGPVTPEAKTGHDSGITPEELPHDLVMDAASLPDTRYQSQIPEPLKTLAPDKPAPAVEAALSLVPAKIAKQVKPVDARFTPFREEIELYWKIKNPGVEMPWDGSEAKRLHELLKACPMLTLSGLQKMLANRERSDVVQSRRPREWIANVVDYANGPIDRYGKPLVQRVSSEASVGSRPMDERVQLDRAIESAFQKFEARTGRQPSAEEWVVEFEQMNPDSDWIDGDREASLQWCQAQIDLREKLESREKEASDAQYKRAVQVVREHGAPSATVIQRVMKVSYAYAVAWLDRMVKDGILVRGQNGFEFAAAEKELQPC